MRLSDPLPLRWLVMRLEEMVDAAAEKGCVCTHPTEASKQVFNQLTNQPTNALEPISSSLFCDGGHRALLWPTLEDTMFAVLVLYERIVDQTLFVRV